MKILSSKKYGLNTLLQHRLRDMFHKLFRSVPLLNIFLKTQRIATERSWTLKSENWTTKFQNKTAMKTEVKLLKWVFENLDIQIYSSDPSRRPINQDSCLLYLVRNFSSPFLYQLTNDGKTFLALEISFGISVCEWGIYANDPCHHSLWVHFYNLFRIKRHALMLLPPSLFNLSQDFHISTARESLDLNVLKQFFCPKKSFQSLITIICDR